MDSAYPEGIQMNPAEIAAACGLTGYSCEGKGIGGILKSRFEDFRVEEVGRVPPWSHEAIHRRTCNLDELGNKSFRR